MSEVTFRELNEHERRLDALEARGWPRVQLSTDNLANPAVPTDGELDTAFGTPAVLGPGFVGLIDENNAHANVILCCTVAASWWYVVLTQAV